MENNCNKCNYIAPNAANLKVHQKIHEERKFSCSHGCGYSFTSKLLLNKHYKMKHIQQQKKDHEYFYCKFDGCDYKAERNDVVIRHNDAVHEKKLKYSCNFEH